MKKLKKYVVSELLETLAVTKEQADINVIRVMDLRNQNSALESQNKTLQTEKENLESANRLHLMKIERLEQALSKFEDLKKEADIICTVFDNSLYCTCRAKF